MAEPDKLRVPTRLQPRPERCGYDLERALSAVLTLHAQAPDDAFTAEILGTERIGNAALIDQSGVVLTIGYLITEAETVTLSTQDGRSVAAHVLGVDQATGFGLLQALEPLEVPALPMGDSRQVTVGESLVMAAGGGRSRALVTRMVARQEFAGYWEYLLEEALFTAPAHPLWSGAALISAEGELVGIGSLRLEQHGPKGGVLPLNMSVPAELLAPVYEDLLRGHLMGGSQRPWLGLYAQEIGGAVVVVGVLEGSPAMRAGLRQGDVIAAVAGGAVSDLAGFYRRLWARGPAGVDVPLRLKRDGDVFDLEVRSADRSRLLKRRLVN